MQVGCLPNSSAVDVASVFNVKQTGVQDWVFTREITILTTILHVLQIIVWSGMQFCTTIYSRFYFQRIPFGFISRTSSWSKVYVPLFHQSPLCSKTGLLTRSLTLSLYNVDWTSVVKRVLRQYLPQNSFPPVLSNVQIKTSVYFFLFHLPVLP